MRSLTTSWRSCSTEYKPFEKRFGLKSMQGIAARISAMFSRSYVVGPRHEGSGLSCP